MLFFSPRSDTPQWLRAQQHCTHFGWLRKQAFGRLTAMGDPAALDAQEAAFWRSLIRVSTVLPRALEDQFLPETGLTVSDYGVLVALSEAPGHLLRISALAATTALSLSRISRVVDDLTRRGLVEKRRCAEDGRAANAVLT